MSSNTRGNNHVQLNLHLSMYKSKFATVTKAHIEGNPTAATRLPHAPSALLTRIAVRDAACQQARATTKATRPW